MTQSEKRYRILILGAGFSRPAGLPVAIELWEEVYRRATRLTGRARQFRDDLDFYIRFRRDCDGIQLEPNSVNFEEFLAFLDVEHHLRLRGSDTWSRDGNETQLIVKTLIGEILTEMTPTPDNVPDLYLRFAERLQPDDYVISLNYDVLLERALERVGKPFRLFPDRLTIVDGSPHVLATDTQASEVVVLKLHGSVDWFDRTEHEEIEAEWRHRGHTGNPTHPVFNSDLELGIEPLLAGPRYPQDPLRQIYRVRNIDKLYDRGFLFLCAPLLLNPSTMKLLYTSALRYLWHGFGAAGTWNSGLAIVGFSLPRHDEYMRQVLYRIAQNYQNDFWGKDPLGIGLTKHPLAMVNLCASEDERRTLMEAFRFLEWSRAELHLDGFDERALDLIFADSRLQ